MHQIQLPQAARAALLFNAPFDLRGMPPAALAAFEAANAGRAAIYGAVRPSPGAEADIDIDNLSIDDLELAIETHHRIKAAIRSDAKGRELTEREERRLEEADIQIACAQVKIDELVPPVARHAVRNGVPQRKTSSEITAASTDGLKPTVDRAVYAQARTTSAGANGFRSAAEFLSAVIKGSGKGAVADPRLTRNAAPGSYGSEGSGGDGGFAVPPDFRTAIMEKVMGVDVLLPMTDNQTCSSNGITFPVDETTPWQSTGGIQAYWDGEGQQKTPSKPSLGAKTIKLNKVIALVPLTDELLEDAPAMSSYVNRKAPEKINYKVNEAIIRGTGVGMPLGILSSPGTVVVAAESAQAAGTVVFQNIMKLWSSLDPVARINAKWLMNPDVEAQIMSMQFPGTGTAVPVYLPPGGLSQSPYGTLLGKPVMPQYACSALGLQGDIIFGDLKNYLTVTKQGGIQTATSIHIWFDYDITAFRFVLRVGGEPWWNAGIVPAQSGALTRGFFATLAARP